MLKIAELVVVLFMVVAPILIGVTVVILTIIDNKKGTAWRRYRDEMKLGA